MSALYAVQDERRLVLGGDPGALYPVPTDWGDEEFQYAPDLEQIGQALIAECPDLAHLHGATVRYLWRRKGQTKAGKATLGTCQKPSGALLFFSGADFIVALAADHVVSGKLTNWQVEALVYHECAHTDWEPKTDKPAVRGHDCEMFRSEIERYGLYLPDLADAADTFRQAMLPGVG